jgi:hypothetical protein
MPQSISIKTAAALKKTTRVTIYSNLHRFNVTDENRIIPNKAFNEWEPKMWGGRIAKTKVPIDSKSRKDL